MTCPEPDVIQALAEGRLPDEEHARVLAHTEECEACRALVAAALADRGLVTSPREAGSTTAEVPDRVGRFRVVGALGEGGMGIVLSAIDPDLDRRVALKLLHADSAAARARLVREAQAMARVSHPNVIIVHEVGTDGDQAFVVMEQIDGGTLRTWLDEARRDWREVRDRFVLAGRGLAAAHAAGLVHRDFKPENVLVGSEGRVCVTDFGLVGVVPSDATGPERGSTSLTRTGTVLGTPRYMAPEQHAGGPVDARADQFSFCVALYEALYRKAPFAGGTASELAVEAKAGRVRPPVGDVPVWLRRAVLRGLAADPAARHPSMAALLNELEHDRARKRARRIAIAAGALAVAGAGVVAFGLRGEACGGATAQLAGVWDAQVKERVRARFAASALPYAGDAFDRVAGKLDGYGDAWAAMHRDTCLATRRGEQSETALDLRMGCLRRRLSDVRALTTLFAGADDELVARAMPAAAELEDLADCADVERLAAPSARSRGPTATLIDEGLAGVRAALGAGRYRAGLVLAAAPLSVAHAFHDLPREAEALYLDGRLRAETGDTAGAETSLFAAVLAADASRADDVKADADIALVDVARRSSRFADALRTGAVATAALERLGADPLRRARLEDELGVVVELTGELGAARAHFLTALGLRAGVPGAGQAEIAESWANLGRIDTREAHFAAAASESERAAALAEAAYGPAHPRVAVILRSWAATLREQGQYPRALELAERALAIQRAALGDVHVEVAKTLTAKGVSQELAGQYRPAIDTMKQALAIYEKVAPDDPDVGAALDRIGSAAMRLDAWSEGENALQKSLAFKQRVFGATNVEVGKTLTTLGGLYYYQGKLEPALHAYGEALPIMTAAHGPDHPTVGRIEIGLGIVKTQLHQYPEALQHLRHALVITEKTVGPDHYEAAVVHHDIGDLYMFWSRCAESIPEEEKALAVYEKAVGPNHPDVSYPLENLGACWTELGQPARAVPILERALAIRDAGPGDAAGLAQTLMALADALWKVKGGDRVRARALAVRARQALDNAGDIGPQEIPAVDKWLAEHR